MGLKVENVVKHFGEKLAVDNISFEMTEPGVFGLLGTNGAGKTTTIRMMLGILKKDSGEITWNGKQVERKNVNFGYLPEERGIYPKTKIYEQLIYFAELKGMNRVEACKEIDYWMERLKVDEYKDMQAEKLSKGNQQKVQFITAILHNPELIVLDEPFSGLDPINVELFMNVIKEYKEKGSMIIFSSHRMEHVELFCEKLVVLVNGRSVLSGKIKDIKKEYRKKNIIINGDVKKEELAAIKGVVNVTKTANDYIVKIEDESYVDQVFNYVKKCSNITKFTVEEPSLNEIFISKVGESYEG